MVERERTDEGTFVERVTLDAVLGVFEEVRGPVITSSDVAEHLDCTTEAARGKLTRLYDRGDVDRRKTGRTVLWWLDDPSMSSETSDEERERHEGTDAEESTVEDEGTDGEGMEREGTEAERADSEPTLDENLVERVRREL